MSGSGKILPTNRKGRSSLWLMLFMPWLMLCTTCTKISVLEKLASAPRWTPLTGHCYSSTSAMSTSLVCISIFTQKHWCIPRIKNKLSLTDFTIVIKRQQEPENTFTISSTPYSETHTVFGIIRNYFILYSTCLLGYLSFHLWGAIWSNCHVLFSSSPTCSCRGCVTIQWSAIIRM